MTIRLRPVIPLLLTTVVCATGMLACSGDIIIDDYRQSRVIVRGTVADSAGDPVSGAVVELTPVSPPFLQGDTVLSDQVGAFVAELVSFGVGTFEAEVRLRARAPSGATRDTVLVGVRVVEERPIGQQPDTVTVALQLPSS